MMVCWIPPALTGCEVIPSDTEGALHLRHFYPKGLTISVFNHEYKLGTTRIKNEAFLQESQTTKVPEVSAIEVPLKC